jgi:hypothetical protein
MKPQSLTALAPRLGERAAVRRYRCHQLAGSRPVEAVHELLPDGVGSVFDAEISLGETESGYQKLADPEVSRVVISRF